MDASQRSISITARPMPMTIEPARTAVIVVDMQNDFVSEGGAFARAGNDISLIQEIITPTSHVLAVAREAGMTVVYLKMEFRPDLCDVGAPGSPNWRAHHFVGAGEAVIAPTGETSRILVKDTWNTDIVDELTPQAADIVVSKRRFSGFYGTELDTILRGLGIKNLIFTGCTTSVCVESTLRDAMFRDYSCLLLADCTAEPIGHGLSRSNHDASLLVVEFVFGSVANSADLIDALEAQVIQTTP